MHAGIALEVEETLAGCEDGGEERERLAGARRALDEHVAALAHGLRHVVHDRNLRGVRPERQHHVRTVHEQVHHLTWSRCLAVSALLLPCLLWWRRRWWWGRWRWRRQCLHKRRDVAVVALLLRLRHLSHPTSTPPPFVRVAAFSFLLLFCFHFFKIDDFSHESKAKKKQNQGEKEQRDSGRLVPSGVQVAVAAAQRQAWKRRMST